MLGGACPGGGQATASGAECLQPLSAAGKKLNGLPVAVKLFQAFRLASQKRNIRSQITPPKSAGKFPSQEASFSEGSSGGIVLVRWIQCDPPKQNRLRANPTDLLIYKPAKKCGHKETEGKTLG